MKKPRRRRMTLEEAIQYVRGHLDFRLDQLKETHLPSGRPMPKLAYSKMAKLAAHQLKTLSRLLDRKYQKHLLVVPVFRIRMKMKPSAAMILRIRSAATPAELIRNQAK